MNNGQTRSSLMAIVAAYLLYTAWQLFQGRNDPESSMSPVLLYLFVVFFVVAAVGLFIYAWKIWKNSKKEEEEEKQARKDENSLRG